ncbi:hypothetical protein RchiOBHm_Chr5g0000081 [Rosa chinensis]|uniref:Uncharacterized protein n=1 Tax=Rosa chinensis TaxID=74649 RepID=A0A2P6Q1W2_ROSCH|nr:hypothetical protein RchiOBHm_Chr5g0000081 [Rosa chinensis]
MGSEVKRHVPPFCVAHMIEKPYIHFPCQQMTKLLLCGLHELGKFNGQIIEIGNTCM